MARSPIFGPFYVGRSTNLADNNLVNLMPELVDDPLSSGKEIGALYSVPGLTLKTTVGAGPIRGMHVYGGVDQSLLFVVSGSTLYQIDSFFTATSRGTVGASGAVSMIDNGRDLAVATGQTAYSWNGTTFASITLPFTASGSQPIRLAYQDGFGLMNWPSTNRQSAVQFFQSALLDLTTWNAANFASVTGDSDILLAPAMIHRYLAMIKERETEIWYNAGTSGFAFARYEGAYNEVGCAAVASIAQCGESLVWLSQDVNGGPAVYMLDGLRTRRISTHAIELQFASYATISDAIAFSYQQAGHLFYVLTFPTADATWVYDVTASTQLKAPVWHQRAAWSGGAFHRHRANCHAYFNGLNLVGDYQNGNIYALDPNALQDNGTNRKWLRSWRAKPKPIEQPIRFDSLRIDMQTGVNIGVSNPQVSLRASNDGGNTWPISTTAAVGASGAFSQRVMFRRLGSTRRAAGLDRIYELSSTDPFQVAIIGAPDDEP